MPEKPDIDKRLLEMVKESSPKTVRELLQLAEKELGVPEKELLEHITRLNDEEKLGLNSPEVKGSGLPIWLWIVVAVSFAGGIVVIIPTSSPLVYVRNVFGLILVAFLPGYSLTRALFPRRQIDTIERAALSIGLSLSLVAIVGLILNYAGIMLVNLGLRSKNSPGLINTANIAICLLSLSIILSLIGAYRLRQGISD